MMKKKIILASVLAAVLILAAVAYFVIVPLFVNDGEGEGSTSTQSATFLVYDKVPREKIASIEVHNEYGDYTLTKTKGDDGELSTTDFEIKGYEGLILSSNTVAYLVVGTGTTTAYETVTDKASEEDLAMYGLDEPQAYYILTDIDGNTYKMYVGDLALNESGYYCRYEGEPDKVYLLNTNLSAGVLKPVCAYVEPLLTYGIKESDYYTADDFTLVKNGEPFIGIVQTDSSEFTNPDATIETHLEYPRYEKTNDTSFNNVMYMIAALTGEETVYLKSADEEDTDKYAEYGIDMENPAYAFAFTYNDYYYMYVFSELQDDGYYYGISNVLGFAAIIKCSPDNLTWMEEDLDYWIDKNALSYNIGRIKSISVETSEQSLVFNLSHRTDDDGNAQVEITSDDGFVLDENSSYLFRRFYVTMLTLKTQGSSGLTDEEIKALKDDEKSLMITLTVSLSDGTKDEYKVYRYSTGKALLTVNGEGNYYIYPDWVEKLSSDMEKMMNYEWVDPYSKK